MKSKPFFLSISGAIIISLFLMLSLFWVFLEYAGSLNSAKEAMGALGNYFSGIATLWAAVIAAYLFNDWREQEKVVFTRDIAISTVELLVVLYNTMQDHRDKNENLLTQVVQLKSQILVKIALLETSLKDDQMNLLSENFQRFSNDYLDVLRQYQHDPQELKNHVSKIIRSFNAETSYLTKLADIDTVFEKISKSALN